LLLDNTSNPQELERSLDLPLPWELSPSQLEAMRRQLMAEQSRAGAERMMKLMGAVRS